MRTISLSVPDFLDVSENDILKLAAAKLYESGKLSLGQAAALAGISKRRMMEEIGDCGVAVFPMSVAELERDIRNA